MRASWGSAELATTQLRGRFMVNGDNSVTPPKFASVCRMLWPDKTAAHIAAIAGHDERTAKRWLSGECRPPVKLVLAVLNELL